MSKLFLIFNHTPTARQKQDSMDSLHVSEIVLLPNDLQDLWRNIPADKHQIASELKPLKEWLMTHALQNDYILIQGDFGACYLMVNFAFQQGYIPIYSTTKREAIEIKGEGDSIHLQHLIKHCIYRKYGE